jgi:hypothetical protein
VAAALLLRGLLLVLGERREALGERRADRRQARRERGIVGGGEPLQGQLGLGLGALLVLSLAPQPLGQLALNIAQLLRLLADRVLEIADRGLRVVVGTGCFFRSFFFVFLCEIYDLVFPPFRVLVVYMNQYSLCPNPNIPTRVVATVDINMHVLGPVPRVLRVVLVLL